MGFCCDLDATGLEWSSNSDGLTIEFSETKRSPEGHLFSALNVRFEDSRAISQPMYEGKFIGPDRVHEEVDDIEKEMITYIVGLKNLNRAVLVPY